MFYYATGVTPAMFNNFVGVGSKYALAFVDADSKPFDGSKTYKLHLPPNIPAKDFLVGNGLRQPDTLANFRLINNSRRRQ